MKSSKKVQLPFQTGGTLAFVGLGGAALVFFGERFKWVGDARRRLAEDRDHSFTIARAAIVDVKTGAVQDKCGLTSDEARELERRLTAMPRGERPCAFCGGPMVKVRVEFCLWCTRCPELEEAERRARMYSEARNVEHFSEEDMEGACLARDEAHYE